MIVKTFLLLDWEKAYRLNMRKTFSRSFLQGSIQHGLVGRVVPSWMGFSGPSSGNRHQLRQVW